MSSSISLSRRSRWAWTFSFASTARPWSWSTRRTVVGFESATTADSASAVGRGLSPARMSVLSVRSSTHFRAL
jgi:hypothetical protein